ncbi:hypothetical protein SAMN04487928_11946 [Butyrivibrio proteoclasticus]|uniref:Uncharacterized protein n=1 Tax=Butyrivibrio proteoclasticus TaxID=43305 RepID=A0A1I5VW21_9FIRM|nr:hypothetical protein [Butyrivibrio proteoclasticus]SFQ11603.1 hypothetical protein SAMN04487928_11946 [Butyrivibrio proteoclasticus]
MKYNKTPVVIFCYSREDKLRRLIESLKECNHSTYYDVFFFCDAPSYKRPDDQKKVYAVQEYIKIVEREKFFHSVTHFFSEEHLGCRKSVINGVSKIIGQYGKVIDLEDDLIVSKDFLDYMEEGLRVFENNKEVWSISGLTFPLKSLGLLKTDFYLHGRGNSCGFATWKDRWELVDWDLKDYDSFKGDYSLQDRFSERGYDMPYLLKQQKEGFLDSWAIEWDYCQFKHEMKTVYPVKSRVYHCGEDGTHVSEDIPQQAIDLSEAVYSFESITENKEIDEEYRELFWKLKDYENFKNLSPENSKWHEYYKILNNWMILKEKEISICQYFKANRMKRIAIYGAGDLAKHLIHEIRKEGLDVVCLIDKNKKNPIDGVYIIAPSDIIPECDVIVITPVMDFYDISRSIAKQATVPVISIAELV